MQAEIDLDFVDSDRCSTFDQLGFDPLYVAQLYVDPLYVDQLYVDQLCFDQRLKLMHHFRWPDLVERSDHCYAASDRRDLVD